MYILLCNLFSTNYLTLQKLFLFNGTVNNFRNMDSYNLNTFVPQLKEILSEGRKHLGM